MISVPQPSMNDERLGALIARLGSEVEGQPGFWRFNFGNARMVCITDETHDRMRVMAPIAALEEVKPEEILTCMKANFDKTIDTRYCINNETMWTVFLHPLNCLTAALFHSACCQVSEAARNFGGSYSSGGLKFNPDYIISNLPDVN